MSRVLIAIEQVITVPLPIITVYERQALLCLIKKTYITLHLEFVFPTEELFKDNYKRSTIIYI